MIDLRSHSTARRSFLHTAALMTAGAGLATLGLMSPPIVVASSKKVRASTGLPFTVFDGTLYRDKSDLSRHGIRPVNIIYGQHFWSDIGKKDQLPERETVKRLAHEATVRGDLGWLGSGPAGLCRLGRRGPMVAGNPRLHATAPASGVLIV